MIPITHTSRLKRALAAGTMIVGLAHGIQAAHNANWRVFRAVDGLKDSSVTAVSVSPKGSVWASHGDVNEISVLDGYTVRQLPAPSRNNFRVYEGHTGQLWSIYSDGLMLYDGTQWIPHPVQAIQTEIRLDPSRQITRQIPLVPVQHDRVLFLLSDKLMEYDASRRTAAIVKEAGPTGLGKFLEMTEARDAAARDLGIWITGSKGAAKLPRPIRQITSETAWQELQGIGDELGVENLRRPFEMPDGELVAAASVAGGDNRRVILRFDGEQWVRYPIAENISQAWPGWDGSIWAFTINSLLRFGTQEPETIAKEHIGLGQFRDVATETNGVFWLAASEGLARYSPFSWRTPQELESIEGLVNALLEDRDGRIWFASAEALIGSGDRQWKYYRWPSEFDAEFRSTDALYQLPNGRIAITMRDRPIVFDPTAEKFFWLVHGEQRRVKLIGKAKDNKLWVQTFATQASGGPEARLEQFDGERFFSVTESVPGFELKEELFFAAESQSDDLWIGGSGGVAMRRHDQWKAFGPEDRFIGGRLFSWLETADGKIWCGSEDRILEYDGTGWTSLRSGMERVTSMTRASNGRIWVATGNGLHCYWKGSWVANGAEEGLPSAAVAKVIEDKSGRVWVGTTRGISLYHPEVDPHPPKTFSPTLNTAARSLAEGTISLTFHAVDKWQYTPASRLLFSYRLDEGQWSPYTNINTRTFDELRAGKHRFEVRAMDRNWNEDPAFGFVEFAVVIPWYKESRLIVILICGLVLVLFFAGLAVNRNRQLIRSYAEVEKIVAQRTSELERANQEVLHSQKMRALGTLAAGIAHDFNNILSIIKGSAQIIETHVEDKEKIRTRVNRIKTVVDQGAGIVKSMLGLTRGTNQDLVQAAINEVVDDTLKLLGDRFLQEATVRFEGAPSLPPVLAVKELIQQMLLNLILNAADAMSGFGEIIVRTGQSNELPDPMALSPAQSDLYVYVAVQDSGCGIAPDVLPRIFEPFFTTKAFSTRRGTGLGLSMVYQLAKEMGYGLKVTSAVGKGSTFKIVIPVRK